MSANLCPVCEGRGLLPTGFYDFYRVSPSLAFTSPVVCRTCQGEGIVWPPREAENEDLKERVERWKAYGLRWEMKAEEGREK